MHTQGGRAAIMLHTAQWALTEATAVPALNNIDKRQDCAWWKDKGMCPLPDTAW